jgi:hypothetical protein
MAIRPKTYFVKMTDNTDGTFTISESKVLDKVNQHTRHWRSFDKRKLTSKLRNSVLVTK